MRQIVLVKGETRTLRYQLKKDGVAQDITGMSFSLAAKERATDATYKLGPVSGAIEDAAQGKFSFVVTDSHTAAVFAGVAELAMYDGLGKKTVLSPPGGVRCAVVESILD